MSKTERREARSSKLGEERDMAKKKKVSLEEQRRDELREREKLRAGMAVLGVNVLFEDELDESELEQILSGDATDEEIDQMVVRSLEEADEAAEREGWADEEEPGGEDGGEQDQEQLPIQQPNMIMGQSSCSNPDCVVHSKTAMRGWRLDH